MQITTDPDHKFDLALALDDLNAASSVITQSIPETEAESKWKALGDHALAIWRFDLAKGAYEKAADLGSLLFLWEIGQDLNGLLLPPVCLFPYCPLPRTLLTALCRESWRE